MRKKKKASEYACPNLIIEMTRNGDRFKDLASLLGLSQKTIFNKINGRTKWKSLEIEKLCSYYKKDYEELFKGE